MTRQEALARSEPAADGLRIADGVGREGQAYLTWGGVTPERTFLITPDSTQPGGKHSIEVELDPEGVDWHPVPDHTRAAEAGLLSGTQSAPE